MDKRIRNFCTGGFFFTCIAGAVMHFVYGWSGKNPAVGLVAPVNESTWEHLKLLYFPAVLWGIFGSLRRRKEAGEILSASAAGILSGMLVIVVFFYTYTGIWGTNWLPMDIFTFALGTFAAFRIAAERRMAYWKGTKRADGRTAAAVLVGIALCFFAFTLVPPPIGLFRAP